MHAVRESKIELHFGGPYASTVVGYLRAGCFVLIELLSINRFRNMPPIWKSWRCCRELRSRAWQRDRIKWNGCGVSQKASVGTARSQRQATKKDQHRRVQSPGHVPLALTSGPEFSRQMDVRLLPGNNAQQKNWSDPNPLRNRLGHSANCTSSARPLSNSRIKQLISSELYRRGDFILPNASGTLLFNAFCANIFILLSVDIGLFL
jgi:hypothetical protein